MPEFSLPDTSSMNPAASPPPPSVLHRREWLATSALASLGGWLALTHDPAQAANAQVRPFRFCLNTGTLRGHNLTLDKEVEIAAQAGYDALEPWLDRLDQFVQRGGSLKELRQQIADRGLTVEDAIGFPAWCVDDDAQRAKGFEDAKRAMDRLAQLGCKRMAAPPAGVPDRQKVEPDHVAERYRQLLELGDTLGVQPVLEFWGRNSTIGRLSTAVAIAMSAGHPKACVLADVFHMYRGGSPFDGLRLLGPGALPVFHMNDYPAQPPLDQINDSHRIFPGDGIAPLTQILRTLQAIGAEPVLSLELFNQEYYKRDALEVARTGLQKMKDVVAKATG
jgi:2-keto-myo-inositol isomerase